jgi:hypothetical protein
MFKIQIGAFYYLILEQPCFTVVIMLTALNHVSSLNLSINFHVGFSQVLLNQDVMVTNLLPLF